MKHMPQTPIYLTSTTQFKQQRSQSWWSTGNLIFIDTVRHRHMQELICGHDTKGFSCYVRILLTVRNDIELCHPDTIYTLADEIWLNYCSDGEIHVLRDFGGSAMEMCFWATLALCSSFLHSQNDSGETLLPHPQNELWIDSFLHHSSYTSVLGFLLLW